MADWLIEHGDCVEVLKNAADNTFDAIVTDPPYGLEFMGKEWDKLQLSDNKKLLGAKTGEMQAQQAWHEVWAAECLRVLKPGGYLLAFGGTRTYHRMACAIEDAGFEVRDSIHWVYGSGFPKSLDVSKAIDKAAGAVRTEVIGQGKAGAAFHYGNPGEGGFGQTADKVGGVPSTSWDVTAPATDAAKKWDGWGTALKPAHEPIVVARKPLVGTVAANVQAHGTGALNIDGCRVATTDNLNGGAYAKSGADRHDGAENWRYKHGGAGSFEQPEGRWPPNILLSHTPDCGETCAEDCAVAEMDQQSGGASRFFPVFKYQAKASRKEREAGLEDFCKVVSTIGNMEAAGRDATNRKNYVGGEQKRVERGLPPSEPRANIHPTVKPVALMEWLIKLVTPPGGVVLDPFAGSGTTGVAATKLGFNFIGIEREEAYVEIARKRIEAAQD